MADISKKWPLNCEGSFFVDDQCIACDACVVHAPRFFKMNNHDGHAYVFNQPKTPAELKECHEALNECPVEAIGFMLK